MQDRFESEEWNEAEYDYRGWTYLTPPHTAGHALLDALRGAVSAGRGSVTRHCHVTRSLLPVLRLLGVNKGWPLQRRVSKSTLTTLTTPKYMRSVLHRLFTSPTVLRSQSLLSSAHFTYDGRSPLALPSLRPAAAYLVPSYTFVRTLTTSPDMSDSESDAFVVDDSDSDAFVAPSKPVAKAKKAPAAPAAKKAAATSSKATATKVRKQSTG